jgi:hypothetical protein
LCRYFILLVALLSFASPARAGLHYSGEQFAELPSQWRGFLLDLRMLRSIAIPPTGTQPARPARKQYQAASAKLEKLARERALTADEAADLGALRIRLGEISKAIEVLRSVQRQHPTHFRLAANLGTAWQLQGDLDQATVYLQQAVRLAPEKLKKVEELHLKLVLLRRQNKRADFDDLFGVRFTDANGRYQPGKMAPTERKKLPAEAVAQVQQLALWLPADGRLLWQLAELAGAYGDVRMAAAMMEGCVSEFGMQSPELRRRRQLARAAADQTTPDATDLKAMHEQHPGRLKMRSKRPLANQFAQAALPPINPKGVNPLPWSILAETAVDRQFKPTFAKHLRALDGLEIELTGFMQPLSEDLDVTSFMLIEYPVGCWYCEMPEITGIILVELPSSKTTQQTRERIKVIGKLTLNATDPENFLYTIRKAKVEGEK